MKSLSTKFSVLRIRKDLRVTRSKCEIRGTRDSGTQLWGTVPVTENFPGHGPVPTPGSNYEEVQVLSSSQKWSTPPPDPPLVKVENNKIYLYPPVIKLIAPFGHFGEFLY